MKAITRLISVLLPEPLDPTSAVVDPAGASNATPLMTGTPSLYSNHTSSNVTRPCTSESARRSASSASSVAIFLISRMRSRPAKASVICVPIEAIEISGAATSPVKKMYITKPPSVMVPATMARPPMVIMITPVTPMISVPNAVVAETPVIDCATLRNSRCTPLLKTISSRFSAV